MPRVLAAQQEAGASMTGPTKGVRVSALLTLVLAMAAPLAHSGSRTVTSGGFVFYLDGVCADTVANLSVDSEAGSVSLELTGGQAAQMAPALADFLVHGNKRYEGQMAQLTPQHAPKVWVNFGETELMSVTFPALDISRKEPASVALQLITDRSAPIGTPRAFRPGPPSSGVLTPTTRMSSGVFRVTIPGLDCSKVKGVDPIAISQAFASDQPGATRLPERIPGKVTYHGPSITATGVTADGLNAWWEQSYTEDPPLREVTIEYLTTTGQPLITLKGTGVGLVNLQTMRASEVHADLFVERWSIDGISPAPGK